MANPGLQTLRLLGQGRVAVEAGLAFFFRYIQELPHHPGPHGLGMAAPGPGGELFGMAGLTGPWI